MDKDYKKSQSREKSQYKKFSMIVPGAPYKPKDGSEPKLTYNRVGSVLVFFPEGIDPSKIGIKAEIFSIPAAFGRPDIPYEKKDQSTTSLPPKKNVEIEESDFDFEVE